MSVGRKMAIGVVVAVMGVAVAAGCVEDTGESGWVNADPPMENIVIKSMHFEDENEGWMATEGATGVGDRGVWYTDDAGQSWEQVHSEYNAYAVRPDAQGQRVWLGGSDQRQLWYSDDGETFQPQADGFEQGDTINHVYFWDDQVGLATTETSDRLHRTEDGGENFEQTEMQREVLSGTNGKDVDGDRVFLAAGTAFTGDEGGARILYSENRAESWEIIELVDQAHDFEGGPLEGIHVVDETEIWAVGANRQMYYTRDGMESWQQVDGVHEDIRHFYDIDGYGDRLLAVGSTSTADDVFVFQSEDGGDSWRMMDFADGACGHGCNLRGVEFVHQDLAYAYGPNNTLLRLGSP